MAKKDKPKLAIHDNLLTYEDMVTRARQSLPKVFTMYEEVLDDPEASYRDKINAGKELTDRAFGKAGQVVEITGKDGGAIEHSFVIEFVRPNES